MSNRIWRKNNTFAGLGGAYFFYLGEDFLALGEGLALVYFFAGFFEIFLVTLAGEVLVGVVSLAGVVEGLGAYYFYCLEEDLAVDFLDYLGAFFFFAASIYEIKFLKFSYLLYLKVKYFIFYPLASF